MAIKKLPKNFSSFIQLHDDLKFNKPELFKSKTIHFMAYTPEGGVTEEYSISIAALERLCWKEIEALRPTREMFFQIMHSNSFPYTVSKNEQNFATFINKISKNE